MQQHRRGALCRAEEPGKESRCRSESSGFANRETPMRQWFPIAFEAIASTWNGPEKFTGLLFAMDPYQQRVPALQ